MSLLMFNTIFNLSNVQNALVNSPTERIKMLSLDVVVKVKAKNFVQELMYGETKKCHQAGFYISDRNVRLAQKDTKLCYCEATIFIKQYVNNPEVVLIYMTNDYTNHVPGNTSEIRTLPLPSEVIKIIEDQLKGGSTCRNTRISVLKQIEEWGVGIRKPNYKDIYNRMRKMNNLLYKFHPDENKSLDIWMCEKLPSQNYCIFTGDLSAYSNNAQHFAFGFQSLSQMMLTRISQLFCLDATYNISARNIEILYLLVTHYPDTGKGFPVTYMITNDHH
ncbi:hypothetical protein PHYBLDRAFT_171100 [Phycomyces blakesleeanus NRRL 1555(-)]|uniref:MULE transposase domain-containing protein n=1 Tax=Phycomyces blakesleeanus (strain ATCC 8743b / DSM 1359 / FGSC 10004 / NBRC 33097 / NRRL 1555) TaxID=763407 RepID=A0A167LT50_PHYB8|nr:hypothetical protein PHYBLDRAFT_171100 [Phycomyces blakesleeanus NRRL 1555(-)]OAD71039.1 hypothetical protein PHYBLDRAFT_171100 [Phycomyces blakesleeanus NRRL 1555(-)]|eukprot:XP_018289079.1 hypothetical protein PHYBLDRAFT_171100 [Phycomyces blakesleeanus NRRL 1555(-)]